MAAVLQQNGAEFCCRTVHKVSEKLNKGCYLTDVLYAFRFQAVLMTKRSSTRRRIQASAPQTQATVELLEDKRLLTSFIGDPAIFVEPLDSHTFQIEAEFDLSLIHI